MFSIRLNCTFSQMMKLIPGAPPRLSLVWKGKARVRIHHDVIHDTACLPGRQPGALTARSTCGVVSPRSFAHEASPGSLHGPPGAHGILILSARFCSDAGWPGPGRSSETVSHCLSQRSSEEEDRWGGVRVHAHARTEKDVFSGLALMIGVAGKSETCRPGLPHA